jgi:hypothetical protein
MNRNKLKFFFLLILDKLEFSLACFLNIKVENKLRKISLSFTSTIVSFPFILIFQSYQMTKKKKKNSVDNNVTAFPRSLHILPCIL